MGYAPHASAGATPSPDDVVRVRARQRERGVPESFEWPAELTPSLRGLIERAGLPVAERPLMDLDPRHRMPAPLPAGVTIRPVAADDPALVAHARDHGVHTVFLAYAEGAVARIYARLGFRPAGTTLLVAGQPARGA
ncbi:hypothetical protein [Streptomyces boluensis]|uniref:hypothetical protein n=1 Tax=Streptomyces boluensis TaxID=1775135 RepID=UPI0028A9AEB0|nr:hypothetical protein [Streptomyces boluensis]